MIGTMLRHLARLALAGALTFGLATPAHADETTPTDPNTKPTTLVIGDSITSRYNDTIGDPNRGWWSYLGERTGSNIVTAAIPGSGMLMRQSCTSTNFGQRLNKIAELRPKTVIVEGGRNDWKTCNRWGDYQHASRYQSQVAIRAFLKTLATTAAQNGVDHVYVITPWGTAASSKRAYIKGYVSKWSARYGLTYIEVGSLPDDLTLDRTHPNEAGSIELARRLAAII